MESIPVPPEAGPPPLPPPEKEEVLSEFLTEVSFNFFQPRYVQDNSVTFHHPFSTRQVNVQTNPYVWQLSLR